MSTTAPPADAIPESPLPPGGEQAWIEVIQKMDEVYNDLLQYEVALEEKNAALEESHQFIESVLASMSDILIVCDRNGGIEEVNASLQHFSGKTAGELEKTPVYDLFADDVERAKARDLFNRFGREGVHDCEFFLRAGDGSTVPVSMNCTPRLSQTGKLMGMVVTGRPVGELRRAYSALRQAHDDLKRTQSQLLHAEKMVSLGRLVAGVAHELNNPISFVLGNVLSLRRYENRLESYLNAVHATAAADDPALAAISSPDASAPQGSSPVTRPITAAGTRTFGCERRSFTSAAGRPARNTLQAASASPAASASETKRCTPSPRSTRTSPEPSAPAMAPVTM